MRLIVPEHLHTLLGRHLESKPPAPTGVAWFRLSWPGADLVAFAAKGHELGPRVAALGICGSSESTGALWLHERMPCWIRVSRSASLLRGEVVEAKRHPEIWHLMQYEELGVALAGVDRGLGSARLVSPRLPLENTEPEASGPSRDVGLGFQVEVRELVYRV